MRWVGAAFACWPLHIQFAIVRCVYDFLTVAACHLRICLDVPCTPALFTFHDSEVLPAGCGNPGCELVPDGLAKNLFIPGGKQHKAAREAVAFSILLFIATALWNGCNFEQMADLLQVVWAARGSPLSS